MTFLIIYIESSYNERKHVMKIKFLASFIVILFSGCSQWVSVNPLSQPSVLDKKLEGTWKYESKEGEEVYLHIGKKTENTMLALSVEHKKDGSLDISEIPFYITMTGVNNYFNVRYKDIDESAEAKENGFIFVKYAFSGDNNLNIYQFNPDVIISAVQSGKLKGEIYYKETKITPPPEKAGREKPAAAKTIDRVKITDTSENMVKFFNSEGNKYIPEVLKFVRMK